MTPLVDSKTDLILDLRDPSAKDANRAGAKAANEAALLQAGFPVPDGFVLTTNAFARFLAANGAAPQGAPETIAAAPIPADVLKALDTGMLALGDGPLAVRSSAVAEDLPGASFAGQYETSLNVRGREELESAVRRCWASVFNEHVIAYRERQALEASPMAVLVQRMVPAEAAGVAFTADPVSGDREAVVINAVRGLGERLVSGQASPDEWIVRHQDAQCQRAPEKAITAGQALSIAALARRVQDHFGAPQDVEWAMAAGQLYLLQARPITVLPDAKSPPVEMIPLPVDVPPGYWVRNTGHQPQPTSPMHNSVFRAHVVVAAKRMCDEFGLLIERIDVQDIGGWEYIRMVPLGGSEGPELPAWLMWLLVRAVPMMRTRLKQCVEAIRTDKASRLIQRWYDEWRAELASRIAELRDVELPQLSGEALDGHLEAVEVLFSKGFDDIRGIHHACLALILYDLVSTCRELLGWDETKAFELLNGTSFQSTEPARRLNELARMAQGRPAVRKLLDEIDDSIVDRLGVVDQEFAQAFARYQREYGCRALRYEVADPTLSESPALLLELIRGQILRRYDPAADEAALARQRAETVAQARAMLAGRPEEVARFERVLERAEKAYPVREDNEYYCVSAAVALLRYAVLELGKRLAERGIIEQRDDVFFLAIDEARSALLEGGDLPEVVQRRKGERAWAAANPGPPSFGPEPGPVPSLDFLPSEARLAMEAVMWYFDPQEDAGRASQSGSSLAGTAVSPGEYTGPVRVIMHEGEFRKLQPGDVLVCPTTSPVWSVLFPSIGALVTDTGGMLSHPAIIAREYRVPAVVALGNITSRLQDGQIVTVDGTAGIVKVRY